MTTLSSGSGSDADQPPHRRGRATMRDVARLAGVGLKTVSRVVNGEPGVAPATAEKVRRAAAELSFQPDLIAGTLRRSGRSRSLGLVLASVDNPFCAAVHRAVEDVAETRGVAVLSASTDESPERERALVGTFVSRRVDGLIISPTGVDESYLRAEMEAGTPVVTVDRPPVGIEADSVVVDNVSGARGATTHLLRRGHRDIAYLGDLSTVATARERLQGYLDAMTNADVPVVDERVIPDLHTVDQAFDAVFRLVSGSEPPTALFTSQNLVTIGAIRALRSLGMERDVAVIGFDDFALSDLLDPAVTVVVQDPIAIGRTAAERVFRRLEERGLPTERIVLPTRLVVRGSGEIPPRRLAAVGQSRA